MKKILLLNLLIVLILFSCITFGKYAGNPVPDSPVYMNDQAKPEERAADLLSYMSLEEKIGQITLIDKRNLALADEEDDTAEYFLGGILSGGGATPDINEPEAWVEMVDSFQKHALQTRLGIPIIYGVDAVHGHNNVKNATFFPHNIGLGAAGDPELVRKVSEVTAAEVAATGIHWNYSPCIAVPQDLRWGRTYEGFSEDTELVSLLGSAAIEGYQRKFSEPDSILATPKHYVADGGTFKGDDQGDAKISEEELREIHLPPYKAAIESGALSIMVSHSSWNGDKLHGHEYLLTDVLKKEMGFGGFIVSDWASLTALPGTYEEQVEAGMNAGIDMVMVPDDYKKFTETAGNLVRKGKIPMERLDDAVYRILKVKFEIGLFENPMTDGSNIDIVGSKEHKEVAREAVRKSLVMLKNENNILPLDKDIKKIAVVGYKANNLGAQCGGWTISWQGERGNNFTEGTTIFEAIQQSVSDSTEVVLDLSGKNLDEIDPDMIINVIGENPYAEWKGDRKVLYLPKRETDIMNNVADSGKPIVTILISGRPLLINDALDQSEAFIAAWLPGTEGLGVTDVLFGDYAPTGKLPYTWPESMDNYPVNVNTGDVEKALFPFGYGLTY